MLKKLICIAATVVLAVSLLSLGTQATTAPRLIAENQTVTTGSAFTLDISLANNPGIISLRVQLEYDPMYLQLERVEDLAILTGMTEPAPEMSTPYILRWADSLAQGNNIVNGAFVRLHFRAINAIEKTDVAVQLIEARNFSGEMVSFAEGRSHITVHNLTEVSATPADHINPGNIRHWLCDRCGKLFADENATIELKLDEIQTPSLGHSFGNHWLSTDTHHWHACDCGVVSNYEQHLYDGAFDASCNTCAYIRPLSYVVGDMNNDGDVTDSDAVYLLRYTLFGEDYPISQPADFNRDGSVTDSDAIYLLRHTLFGEDYPLDPM